MQQARRLLDLLGAGLGLALFWPLFLLIAVLIKLEDGGPVLLCQQRIGRDGVPFRMLKFRSMRFDRRGPLLTAAGDSRVTRVGRLLRRSKLDELPQLLHVLMGQMRLVGPRPEVGHYVALYTSEQRRMLALIPGITDPAPLAFIDEERLLAGAANPKRR